MTEPEATPCTASRDLFADGSTVLTCGQPHHTDNLAHRMSNPDGTVTTWRDASRTQPFAERMAARSLKAMRAKYPEPTSS